MKIKRILAAVVTVAALIATAGCSRSASTDGDWDAIEKKGELVVGITMIPPLNYMEDGELVGFETEFTEAVCDKLGIEPEFQEIDWGSKEMELTSKNIDCIWNGMTITDSLKESLSITKPYMRNKQVLVAKKDKAYSLFDGSELIESANVVAEVGSVGEELANENDDFNNAKLVVVDSQAKALMDVEMGTADIAIIDYVAAIGSIGEGTEFKDLEIIENHEYMPEYYGIAFRKGSDALDKVQEAIDELMSDGTIEKIADKYNLKELVQK